MTVRPLHDRVLIKRIDEQETVRGGIIIPDTAKEKSQEGEVIAVGTGKMLENGSVAALEVKAGDRILFGKYSGTEIKLEGQDYLILRDAEIVGIWTQTGKAAGKKEKGSSQTAKQIVHGEDSRQAVWRGVNILASAAKIKLVPHGRNVALDENVG